MVEIVFSESACACLKEAYSYGRGPYPDAAPAMVYYGTRGGEPLSEAEKAKIIQEHHEQERKRWETAVPMEGSTGDVYDLGYGLSAGDISEEEFGEKRMEEMLPFYADAPERIDGRSEIMKKMKRWAEGLERAMERIREGEPVRIWYSDNPDEACGMLWFLWKIHRLGISCREITAVKLPGWIYNESTATLKQMQSWGELEPGLWGTLKENGHVLPQRFCEVCAMQWEALRRENAPLRAVMSGRVVSVEDDFYDRFLLDAFESPQEEVREGRLIGRVLNRQLGVWDGWLHLRIGKFIDDGRIEVVKESEADQIYGRILRKR
ncbi:MAG: DUF3658 domain-containing protein [Anaerovoracaceae bacterium]|nr:DUF3658 domain-containing protein [Anaerovoracaceae bacterium]